MPLEHYIPSYPILSVRIVYYTDTAHAFKLDECKLINLPI